MASGGIEVTPGRVLGPTELWNHDKLNDLGTPTLRILAGSVTSRELADGSISADKLDVDLEAQLGVPDGSVTTDKIVDNAVTTAKIQEEARVPVGVIMDFAGTVAPTGWILCYGQAINRTTYAALFSIIGTTFGIGDGSTTFNLPDCRGRVSAGKDNMGGSSANRLTIPFNGDNLGAAGGAEEHTLLSTELASHTHSYLAHSNAAGAFNYAGGGGFGVNTSTSTGTVNGGSGAPHNNTQPTIIFNKIIHY